MAATLADMSSATLPEFIVLDASVVSEWAAPATERQPHYAVNLAFMGRLSAAARDDQTLVVLPMLALIEVFHAQCKWVLKPQWLALPKPRPKSWMDYQKANPSAIGAAMPRIRQALQDIIDFPMWIPEPGELAPTVLSTADFRDRVPDLMHSFQMLSADATILAVAQRLAIPNVASLDVGWRRATGFTLFTAL